MTEQDPKAALAKMINQLERSAYRRGWEDAIQHVLAAASEVVGKREVGSAPAADQRAKASYGAVPTQTVSALRVAGDKGVTPSDVVVFGRSRGEEIAESSVRRELGRMVKNSTVRRHAGRYFLVQRQDAGEESGDAATSPSDAESDDGPYHAAA